MLVLPEPVVAQARRHPLSSELYVTDTGYFPTSENRSANQPAGFPPSPAGLTG